MQSLTTELYKIKNKQELFAKIFAWKTESYCNLRMCNEFRIPSTCAAHHSSESNFSLGPKIWNIFPGDIK